jgi:hypothetical protein
MSFGFTVIGDREQVTEQLKAIKEENAYGDSLRNGIIDLLAEQVGKSELHGYKTGHGQGYRQQYVIEVSGHSGPESSFSLAVSVKAPYVSVSADPEPEAGKNAPDAG